MNVSMSNVVNLSVMMETPEYRAWIAELKNRYRSTQIKASMSVNAALLEYYLNLGRDIEERYSEAASYAEFYRRLSGDLRITMPEVGGHSPVNLKYCNYFYRLYKDKLSGQQVADFAQISGQQLVDFQNGRINLVFSPVMLLMIPWGHHLLIGYLASCDLELNGEGDNPAFGLVVCKGRNETLVRYMLGKTNMPIGVSEYELLRCLPEEFKSDMPTTDELESEFNLADEHSSRSGYDEAKGSDAPTEKLV